MMSCNRKQYRMLVAMVGGKACCLGWRGCTPCGEMAKLQNMGWRQHEWHKRPWQLSCVWLHRRLLWFSHALCALQTQVPSKVVSGNATAPEITGA